ncbi:MAG: hypothetical protein O6850_03765, partial [Acidobacteria bacterium]|nr:hypothetical protein [Acidobacteriota bacterium]
MLIIVMVIVPPVVAQEKAQSEREAMYYRYLEFPKYVKGGEIEPHWMDRARDYFQEHLKPYLLGVSAYRENIDAETAEPRATLKGHT